MIEIGGVVLEGMDGARLIKSLARQKRFEM